MSSDLYSQVSDLQGQLGNLGTQPEIWSPENGWYCVMMNDIKKKAERGNQVIMAKRAVQHKMLLGRVLLRLSR